MYTLKEVASRTALNSNHAVPNGIIKTNSVNGNYCLVLNTTAFKGVDAISSIFPVELITTSNLNELICSPLELGVKALIYGLQTPFFCDNWSHTIITADSTVIKNCSKNKEYIIDADFSFGVLSYLSGYTALIY